MYNLKLYLKVFKFVLSAILFNFCSSRIRLNIRSSREPDFILEPALSVSFAKVALSGLLRAAELYISNNNGKTTLKNSGSPKAIKT